MIYVNVQTIQNLLVFYPIIVDNEGTSIECWHHFYSYILCIASL